MFARTISLWRRSITQIVSKTSKRWKHAQSKTCNRKYKAYLLTSESIYENLAFENWLYSNEKFNNVNLLLLWRSKPCVVIGRHQNPWVECDLRLAQEKQIDIARRYSGGGTVYHDLGNLNCSFFTSRADYDRTRNSQLIVDALRKYWDLDVAVASVRDDIFLEAFYKISGSSSKLGQSVAYHHCTLLFDVDKDLLSGVLHTNQLGLKSNATESIRSRVKNLSEVNPELTYETLTKAIAELYLSQGDDKDEVTSLQFVDPTCESRFPGISEMSEELKTWNMIYGRTPKFSVKRTFSQRLSNQLHTLKINIDVDKGLIKNIDIVGDKDLFLQQHDLFSHLQSQLLGTRFVWESIEPKLWNCGLMDIIDKDYFSWVIGCIHKLFTLR